jgi:HTH-type transcriptional regulator/antitoxin HigA
MAYAQIKEAAHELFEQASFISQIKTPTDYKQALALMDDLIEDYDNQRPLINIVSAAIEAWENKAPEFAKFNARISDLDAGVSTLKLLMEQHDLRGANLPEIGSKSLVSKILNHERNLTRQHIDALSKRFKISPALFF